MRSRRLLLLLVLALTLTACDRPPAAPAPGGSQAYGAALTSAPAMTIAAVLATPAEYEGRQVLVSGHVRQACSNRGCWMELAESAAAAQQGCRVTFKDYAFFVPTDAAGSSARVEGVVQTAAVPKEQVDHLEAEGARFAAKLPDGSAREVRIVASGVELTRPGSQN